MENAPHIILAGRNIPPDIKERYYKWNDAAYVPLYLNIPGYIELDYYEIIKKSLEYPESLNIHHAKKRRTFEESRKNQSRIDLQKDYDATFYRMVWLWHEVYYLIGSFSRDSTSPEVTFVENAPFIHFEGYRVPTSEQDKFDQWFMKWASHVYIPLILKSPGLKGCNCFKLSDLSMRWPGHKYLATEIPACMFIFYFENAQAFENYEQSPECAALKRSMELELPDDVKIIWNVEYQLAKSWRK
jgi:hypothetical protein